MLFVLRKIKDNNDTILKTILISCSIVFIVTAFCLDTPSTILTGLGIIIRHSDKLITDYVAIAGWGATFLNAGLLMLIAIGIICLQDMQFTGNSVTIVFWMAGFGMFGKNIINIWSILLGVYLYSKFTNTPFSKYTYIALFGTALAPLTTEILLWSHSYLLSTMVGVTIGFILPCIAMRSLQVHQGYNLYNVGFAAGVIGVIIMSVMRTFNYIAEPSFFWHDQWDKEVIFLVYILFLLFIIIGCFLEPKIVHKYKVLITRLECLKIDFIILDGVGVTLFNMGLLGIIYTTFVLLIGSVINGATLGAILAIVGFGAFGKHVKNTIPIVIGVILGTVLGSWSISDPSVLLAALFGTALAPITSRFGIVGGIIAGVVHLLLVLLTGSWHGWTNLYNNGLAAGIVALFLVPILEIFKDNIEETINQEEVVNNI